MVLIKRRRGDAPAIAELLESRRSWNPKKLTFVGVVIGAMKSIASNHKAKSLRNGYSVPDSQLAGNKDEEDQGGTPLELLADTRPAAELQMILTERVTEVRLFVEGIYEFFEADAEAQLVMNGWREGRSGAEIIIDLGIDRSAYETIAKRIRGKAPRDGRREAVMSVIKGWSREETERILEELAVSIEAAEPAEIAADLKDGGVDLIEIESRMKAAALSGIKTFKQKGLHRARERYQESSARIERQARGLTESSADRRRRFFQVLETNPEIRSSLTVQHRDLTEMTEDDIDSALEEMEILGVLGEPDDNVS